MCFKFVLLYELFDFELQKPIFLYDLFVYFANSNIIITALLISVFGFYIVNNIYMLNAQKKKYNTIYSEFLLL